MQLRERSGPMQPRESQDGSGRSGELRKPRPGAGHGHLRTGGAGLKRRQCTLGSRWEGDRHGGQVVVVQGTSGNSLPVASNFWVE